MIVFFAPIVALLLGVTDIQVPWEILLTSVLVYIIIPLSAGISTQKLMHFEKVRIQKVSEKLKPLSTFGLLAIIILLFGFQGFVLLTDPFVILLISVPLLFQTYGIFSLTYLSAKFIKLPHDIAAPGSLIATSNFFELAVAVAISIFGLNSGAALATVVGVLVEVPVMLSLVWFCNKTRNWFAPSE